MRSLFKLSLASLAAFALAVGSAWAQAPAGVSLQMDLQNAFGLSYTKNTEIKDKGTGTSAGVSFETDNAKTTTSESHYKTEFQSDFNLAASNDMVVANAKIRFRDENGANPNTNRAQIYWKAAPTFQIGWLSRAINIPVAGYAYGTYNSTVCSGGCTIGEKTGLVGFFANSTGLDLRYVQGDQIMAGVALLDGCVPACGYTPAGASTGGDNVGASSGKGKISGKSAGDKNQQSLVPYFGGTFGALKIGAYLSNTSGVSAGAKTTTVKATSALVADAKTTKDDDKAVTGTLLDVNGVYDLGAAKVALEYGSMSQSCDKGALNRVSSVTITSGVTSKAGATELNSKCDPLATTYTALGARVMAGPGQLEVHYVTTVSTQSVTIVNADTAQIPVVALANGDSLKIDTTGNNTDLMVGFSIPMAPNFWLVPLFASNTDITENKLKVAGGSAVSGATSSLSEKITTTVTQSLIALGARATF